MAYLLKCGERPVEIQPENGKSFTLKECYTLLDVDLVELIRLSDDSILICDEEGKLKGAPVVNDAATTIYRMVYGPVDVICGNAILCKDKEFR